MSEARSSDVRTEPLSSREFHVLRLQSHRTEELNLNEVWIQHNIYGYAKCIITEVSMLALCITVVEGGFETADEFKGPGSRVTLSRNRCKRLEDPAQGYPATPPRIQRIPRLTDSTVGFYLKRIYPALRPKQASQVKQAKGRKAA